MFLKSFQRVKLKSDMKVLTFIVLALVAAAVKGNKEMLMPILTECKASVGATDEDLAKMMMHSPPENQAQKCLFSCLMIATGCVS